MNSWELADRLIHFARLIKLGTNQLEFFSFIDSATTIRSLDLDCIGIEMIDHLLNQCQIRSVAYDYCREIIKT